MEDFVRIFRSPTGDLYHIAICEELSVLSPEAIQTLKDIDLVGVELRRLKGENATGLEVLAAIENTIAECFIKNKKAIVCYYCDFVNPIPHTLKNSMPAQEYRSRLFAKMFQRYSQYHDMKDVRLSVIEINGINQKYYFHIIYRECHRILASMRGQDLKESCDK